MTLLDIGCGWGATLMRAIEKYDVNVVGLTLSKNQQAHVQKLFDNSPSTRSKRVLLQGWEQFDEPVDRIVSIGAFEHFGFDRYDPFFKMAYHVLPADGAMLLHTIIQAQRRGVRRARHADHDATPAGSSNSSWTKSFRVAGCPRPRWSRSTPRRPASRHPRAAAAMHYARTLEHWAAALQSRKDEAIAIQSEEVYERYMNYLTGCAELFRDGYTDVCQFTCEKG